ncbi:hypothetical protein [Nocardia veterana]|uniref:Uncharacterized protein n=1 Tax=Nocardia veterana TaxID=132249 RepID=A0A7X6M010_9NOCA|nr:hypothetical protein [Nocardia veterana]NKY87239.1 hypothetical protein [Nocardia veterana]
MAVEVGQSESLKVTATPAADPQYGGILPGMLHPQALLLAQPTGAKTPGGQTATTPARTAGTSQTDGGKPAPKHPTPDPGKQPEYGVGKHYWTVELVPPPGGSVALKSFVSMAETAIQTAVDMLGRGTMKPPPNVNDLLTTKVYKSLGQGEASDSYQETLNAVQARQTNLLTLDNRVLETAIHVAAGKDQTLAAIKTIVGKLQTELKSVGKAKLKSAQEIKLMEDIADALDAVIQKVSAVAEFNSQMAGKGKSDSDNKGGTSSTGAGGTSSGTNGGTSNGTGGADAGAGGGGLGALGQMLPMLGMMLPMGLMALAPIVQQVLQGNQRQHEQNPQLQAAPGTAQPAAPAAPSDPAQPAPGQPAAAPAVASPATAPPSVEPAGVTAPPGAPAPAQPSGSTPPGTAPAPVGAAPAPPANTGTPSVTPPDTGQFRGTSYQRKKSEGTAPDAAADPVEPEHDGDEPLSDQTWA